MAAYLTAALAVPIVLIRRQRARTLLDSLPPKRAVNSSTLVSKFSPGATITSPPSANMNQWPPPRRSGGATQTLRFTPRELEHEAIASSSRQSSLSLPLNDNQSKKKKKSPTNDFESDSAEKPAPVLEDHLYAVKAFGYATAIVVGVAAVAGWMVTSTMGVNDAQEFAAKMHGTIFNKLSFITHPIHRAPLPSDSLPTLPSSGDSATYSNSTSLHSTPEIQNTDPAKWKWSEASVRLEDALDKEGVSVWAEKVVEEIELEARKERRKRGLEGVDISRS